MVHQSRPFTRQVPDPIRTPGNQPRPADAALSSAPSPKGWKKHEPDCVGLAIVAALERTSGESTTANVIVSSATSPIAIASPRRRCPEAAELCLSGRFATSVCGGRGLRDQEEADLYSDLPPEVAGGFQVADFLSYCYLCRKRLHGKDIYMYRGDKAFCSIECRCQQIVSDEYQEICGSEASRSATAAEASSSPYSGGRIFYPGIVVS
ncbi:hypothetical protein Cni_G20336 [Canna indica]|uniref:FLZ-type domain-containing protein n=1 Tax=Canna indica TaxID=4628 RepID=A0AAQ3KPR3_9LILI|nr:hypothetical protein Cni_G20336 [Canna indica]